MVCDFLLHEVGKFPSSYLELDRKEKSFVAASVLLKLEQKIKQAKEAERNSKRRK